MEKPSELITTEPVDTAERYENVSYQDAKLFIRTNLTSAARSFIAVGYYLKQIRDTSGYLRDGFSDIWEFAQAEYGISKSTASRYMTMNDRFSENGNSPVIQEAYKDFGKSQLQEMLSLTDEQMDQVKPTDRVEDIRGMRTPRKIPYVPIPGQMNITDFPGITPEAVETADKTRAKMETDSQERPVYTIRAEDLAEDKVEGADPSVARSQQAVQIWQEDHQPDERYNITDLPQAKESLLLQLARMLVDKYGSQLVLSDLDSAVKNKTLALDREGHGMIALNDGVMAYASSGSIIEFYRDDEDLGVCTYARLTTQVRKALDGWTSTPGQTDTVVDGEYTEYTEVSEPEEYTPRYFWEEQSGKLDRLLEAAKGVELNPNDKKVIERQKTIVEALASMVTELEKEQLEAEKPQQPELPLLKNNDQRGVFIDAYETWPLWIETVETGERYYRYDLPDGTAMVVKVYHAMLFDSYPGGGYEARYKEGYGLREFYLLQPDRFFRDCESNRSALIEKLKEVQKGRKDENHAKTD